jgi:hypothetical protein
MECDLAPTHACDMEGPESFMWNGRSQMWKPTYYVIPSTKNVQNKGIFRRKASQWVPGAREKTAFGDNKNILKLMVVTPVGL